MARLIAIEWDTREARIAVASQRGNDLIVEQAFAVELTGGVADEAPSTSEVGTQLAAALASRGLTGGDALVAVPRSQIELRTLTLPHAPPEEIPDMVRFQAMQAFTSIGEDWPLDYIELDAHDESINVLATVASPKLVKQAGQVCAASELKARCLVLRPFAAVSLLHRFESIDVFRSSLVVDVLPDGADLTAMSNGQVVFMRSVRLPQHSDVAAQAVALVGELRRTIGAAQNQMGGSRIEQIIICGGQTEHAVLYKSISDALPLDVVAFDPFEAVRLSRELKQAPPENSGRFAPLLGMLAAQATGTGHAIDFLNPRKRPKPPSNKKRNLMVAGGVAAVLLLGTFIFLSQKHRLDNRIALLTGQSKELDEDVSEAKRLVAKADRIREFTDGDITWLDEIREVASRLPDADHVILSEVSLGPDRIRGGRLVLKGNVVSSEVIAELEEDLRYGSNNVDGRMGLVDRSNRDYPYQLDTTITVPPDVQKDGHSVGRPKVDKAPKVTDAATVEKVAEPPLTSEQISELEPKQPDEDAAADAQTPAATEEAATEDAEAKPASTEPTAPEPAAPEPAATGRTATGRAAPVPAMPGPATPEPATPEPDARPADGVPADGVPADGVPADGVPADGVPADGVPADGVPEDGVPEDGVPEDGVPDDGVPDDGVPDDGVPDDGVPEDGVPEDGVPEDGVPEDGVPEDGVPEDGVPEDGVPEDGASEPAAEPENADATDPAATQQDQEANAAGSLTS